MNAPNDPTRRDFIKAGAALGAGLTLGFHLTPARAGKRVVQTAAGEAFAPNAFIRVAPDNTVTVLVKHLEMGQGVQTGLPALVAEELEVPWESIRVEAAPADHTLYNNLLWGPMQGTGGSTAMGNSYEQLRRAGATTREMLREAAALTWGVDKAQVLAEAGRMRHVSSNRALAYGELVERAAGLEVPHHVKLKPASQFKIIGRGFKRTDSRAKSDGSARFGMDLRLPGMLTAVVLRPPRFGDKLKTFYADKALARPGVKAVFEIPAGVAVVATDTWSAIQGRLAVKAEWEAGPAAGVSSDTLLESYRALLKQPGTVARNDGDAGQALAGAARTLAAEYEVPFLAHAPMEPLNCVAQVTADGCEIWTGDQFQTMDQKNAAAVLGLAPEKVRIHTLFAGGSFGRRANVKSDYVVEAVHIAKRMGVPVKTVWTREDDIRGGFYRPCYAHRLEAGLDAQGAPVAWTHRIVGQSIVAGTPFAAGLIKDGIDHTSVEGAATLPYAIPNLRVELHSPTPPIPVLWWRSVGSSHTAFATEVFLDEVAQAAGEDPVALRRRLLKGHPRHLAVLELAAAKAGWGSPLPKGWGRGVAVHESFHSFVAEVAEVSVAADGSFKVERVVCAVDCGLAVTPDVIRAQMEGGIGFGLSAALHGEITLQDGRTKQGNFDDYKQLRISEMPQVEVHIVASDLPPTGVGEPGVPPIAPAVVNALFAATGKRIRKLPIGKTV
ncbi:MAG TPA: xanthine dehydrogenase family protein molybdopterin-binding subunit [Thiobacillaceae bacterium]|nr:xanthine dehydrogenase family protein molybdopterin-binding subunit [Thiobacillaceae bacterium]